MTTSATIAAIQVINAAISGVTTAPNGSTILIPGSVVAAQLPICIVLPGTLDMSAAARSEIESTQQYTGIVLVAGQAQGVGVNDTVAAVWTLWDAFKARYNTLIGSTEELTGGLVVLSYHSEGQRAVTWRGGTWEGFVFDISVWEPS